MLYSPINYPGNKSRIVDELLKFVPSKIRKIQEIFCGSAVFSISSTVKNIHINDIEERVLQLLKYLRDNPCDKVIYEAESIIDKHGLTDTHRYGRSIYPVYGNEGLSNHNREGFTKLRSEYNVSRDPSMLFVLAIYGFNHYLRFNSKGEFNIPVGKMDFSTSIRNRTRQYCKVLRDKNLTFSNCDFRDKQLYNWSSRNTLFYFDPPYLISQAPYNIRWSEKDERDLYTLLGKLNERGCKFLLSNVLLSNGRRNDFLEKWSKSYKTFYINRQYTNANYRRKRLGGAQEIVVLNY